MLIIVWIPGITSLRIRAIPPLIVPSVPAGVSSTISWIVIAIGIIHGWRRSRIPLVWILVHGNGPLHLRGDRAEETNGKNKNNTG
jgi:hypothetical protein